MIDMRKRMEEYRKARLEELAKKIDFEYVNLTLEQEKSLLEFILAMPVDKQNILIFKHYYNHSFEELENLLDIENAKGEYLNLMLVLSENLNLKNAVISNDSMDRICDKAIDIISEEIDKEYVGEFKHEFDRDFKKKKNAKYGFYFVRKRVACFVLSVFITFGVLAGANAYANGKIFEWIISTFEKYSSFSTSEENMVNKDDVNIEIIYIPEGFELKHKMKSDSVDIYYYEDKGDYLVIKFLYGNVNSGLNTEGEKIEKFKIDGSEVMTWKKENRKFFLLSKRGITLQIYGSITKDEFTKIYEGILLEKK